MEFFFIFEEKENTNSRHSEFAKEIRWNNLSQNLSSCRIVRKYTRVRARAHTHEHEYTLDN